MFGYIRPFASELLVREHEQYKAVYCALCRELGKSFGVTARFTLSYDCTFYALLALCISEEQVKLHKGVCTMNPLKKCSYILSQGTAYQKAAALSVLMTAEKLKDNVRDDGFWKGLPSRLLLPLLSSKAKKAGARYPFMKQAVEAAMAEQRETESGSYENSLLGDESSSHSHEKSPPSIDRCAHPTATMLGTLFRELAGCPMSQQGEEGAQGEGPDKKTAGLAMALERFGYFLGRWVYLMDAADDLKEDLEQGSFNPFLHRLGLEGKETLTPEEEDAAHESCNTVLNGAAAQMLLPFQLIALPGFGSIVENIVEKGLPEMQREILFLHPKRKVKKADRNKTL